MILHINKTYGTLGVMKVKQIWRLKQHYLKGLSGSIISYRHSTFLLKLFVRRNMPWSEITLPVTVCQLNIGLLKNSFSQDFADFLLNFSFLSI